MKLNILASGSAANCYILSCGEDKLILDCGVKFSALQKALDYDYNGISACLLSHAHQDHAKSINDLAKAGIDIYASAGSISALGVSGHRIRALMKERTEYIGNWAVKAIETQHDAPEPYGFLIAHKGGERLLYATDTYYLKYAFPGINYWLIECNYVTDRLNTQYESGEIEMSLYRRLLQSHMSLENLKTYLAGQDLTRARKIVLLHLSDARSDEKRMVREIHELTGVETTAARSGLEIALELYPF